MQHHFSKGRVENRWNENLRQETKALSPSAFSSQSQLFVPFSVSLLLFPQHVVMSSVLVVGSSNAVALHKCYKHFSCGQRECGEQGQISVKKIMCVHRTAAGISRHSMARIAFRSAVNVVSVVEKTVCDMLYICSLPFGVEFTCW